MSRGPYPILLMLAMSLPGAAKALGLGDIRVDSALNEPLSAQIDIVGATRDDLAVLTAKIASREMFQRYGADRPAFLAGATFKVGLDSQGRPVLNVRSAEAFTDPVVNFLVDLRWGRGEVIREYSLLLDPAGFSATSRATETAVNPAGLSATPQGTETAAVKDPARLPATVPAPTAVSTPTAAFAPTGVSTTTVESGPEGGSPPGASSSRAGVRAPAAAPSRAGSARSIALSTVRPLGSQHRVVAGDTLRTIARRAGARTESQAQRMMILIFRANPHAFEGNINNLHLGAMLEIPGEQALTAIDGSAAKREVRAQMTAWRLDGRPARSQRVASTAAAGLTDRIQSLEKALGDANQRLAAENTKIQDWKQKAAQEAALAASQETVDTAAAAEAQQSSPMQVEGMQGAEHPAPAQVERMQAAEHPAPAQVERIQAAEHPAPVRVERMQAAEHPTSGERMHAEEHPATVLAAMAPSPGQPALGKGLWGSMAAALALLVGGFAYLRRQMSRGEAASAPPLPVHQPLQTFEAGDAQAAAQQQPEDAAAATAPRSRLQERPPPVAADAIVAREIQPRTQSTDFDETLGIDTVALEMSYLESLGADGLGIDETAPHCVVENAAGASTDSGSAGASDIGETAVHDTAMAETAAHATAEMHTVALDVSELDTAIVNADFNTAILDIRTAAPALANTTVLDYNLLDLDATMQHVQMSSDLLNAPQVKDRRTDIVDVLKMAIERDPGRSDLRMKLLETHFSAASTNQRGFLDVVRKLSREPHRLSAEEWQKVIMMGRAIAPDDILFADQPKDGLADCA
ncbi:MAG TPA: FimV/HubP family polar landmark protein [Steroidobacteraceae bacterium]|nr:FimV/HubP family polar landmark protein [Steroidobacteraceae bacterium]